VVGSGRVVAHPRARVHSGPSASLVYRRHHGIPPGEWFGGDTPVFRNSRLPGSAAHDGTLAVVPSWTVSGSANHPWVLKLSDDQDWTATVRAEWLEVTADGTLVFFDFGAVALVIQPRHYSFVSQIGWDGLSSDV
jgi:hypothetical protein